MHSKINKDISFSVIVTAKEDSCTGVFLEIAAKNTGTEESQYGLAVSIME